MYLPKVTEEFRARKLEEAKQWGWFVFLLEWIKIKIFRQRKIIVGNNVNQPIEKVKFPTFGDVFTEAKMRWDNADEQGKELILEEHKAAKERTPKDDGFQVDWIEVKGCSNLISEKK